MIIIENNIELPSDYEACSECGFDHEYEYEEAAKWHKENNLVNKVNTKDVDKS